MSQRNTNSARPVLTTVNSKPQDDPTQNPYAAALFQFIQDVKDDKDKKSRFYKEVVVEACNIRPSGTNGDARLALSQFVTDLEVQHQKKSSTRKALTSLQPLVTGLYQFTSALDVMIQADPTGAGSLIYGGAKLILQLASGYTRYFEELSKMLVDVGHQLQCFHLYTRAFASDEYMNRILISSYMDILGFWKEASGVLEERGKRFLARGVLKPFSESYKKFQEKLERNAKKVREYGAPLHFMKQEDFNNSQISRFNGLAQGVNQVLASQKQQIGTKKNDIRRWISGGRVSRINPERDLEKHLSSRHHGTAQWIFQDPQFSRWHNEKESTALWINAAPGAGKSVLMATIIEKLKDKGPDQNQDTIYFFCRFDEQEKSRALSALRSIALQALELINHIPDELYSLYEDEFSDEEKYIVTVDVAEKVIELLLKRIERAHIVIDAVDECNEARLIDSLLCLSTKKSFGITKWLFSSRSEPEIIKKFSKIDALPVPKTAIENDIRLFLNDNSDLFCGTCDQLDQFAKMTEGNFLQARLSVDPFRNEDITCREEFDEMLMTFQPGLGRCWYRSLQKLSQASMQLQELTKTMFNSVLLAAQPMTFNEVVDLLSIRIGDEPSSRRRRNKTTILSACSPFIEIDYTGDLLNPTMRVAHKSVGDFLLQEPSTLEFVDPSCYKFFVNGQAGNLDLGKRCLTYLSYKRYEAVPDLWTIIENKEEHGFLIYAAVFWYQHLDLAGGSQELFDLIRDLFRSPNFHVLLKIQSKYAPHLFAKMSFIKERDSYRIQSPKSFYGDSVLEDTFYADAMPLWLQDYDKQGDNLALGYHLFVREWADILIQNPEGIQEYFSDVLGSNGFRAPQKAVRVTALEDFSNERMELYNEQSLCRTNGNSLMDSLFLQTPKGLKCAISIVNEDREPPIAIWEEWSVEGFSDHTKVSPVLTQLNHVNLRREIIPGTKSSSIPRAPSVVSSSSMASNRDQLLRKNELSLLSIDLISNSEGTIPGTSDIDLQNQVLSRLIENRFWFMHQQQQERYAHSPATLKFPSSLAYVRDILGSQTHRGVWLLHYAKSIHEGDIWATMYRFKLAKEEEDEDHDDDSEEEDGADDDNENDDKKSKNDTPVPHEPALLFLSISKAGDSVHWFHHVTKSGILQKSMPIFHPREPILLWAQNERDVLLVNTNTWTTDLLILPSTDEPLILEPQKSQLLVFQGIEFHVTASLLHRVNVYVNLNSPLVTLTHSFLSLQQQADSFQIYPTTHPQRIAEWRYPGRTPHLPISLAWADDVLYAALGSCEVTLLRFPPEPSTTSSTQTSTTANSSPTPSCPQEQLQIYTLTKPLYIPSSSHSRSPHFFVTPSSATFALNGLFIGKPSNRLPPLIMTFSIGDFAGNTGNEALNEKFYAEWKIYESPSGNGEKEGFQRYLNYMKGVYASKENAFSVPIRSGLEWTRGTYVTCW